MKILRFLLESENTVLDMIYQILDAHPNSKYIHMGGDEVSLNFIFLEIFNNFESVFAYV